MCLCGAPRSNAAFGHGWDVMQSLAVQQTVLGAVIALPTNGAHGKSTVRTAAIDVWQLQHTTLQDNACPALQDGIKKLAATKYTFDGVACSTCRSATLVINCILHPAVTGFLLILKL